MLKLLLETLRGFEGVEYLISETKTHRIECYNIKNQPEMKREAEITDVDLVLYKVFEETAEDGTKTQYRGSFNTEIHPGVSDTELREIIKNGLYAAGFVKNAYYPLVTPKTAAHAGHTAYDIRQTLEALQTAFYATDGHTLGHISYSEFFITKKDTRILNSNGVDVSYTTHDAFIETAVHWQRSDKTEIEVSEAFRFSLDLPHPEKILKERMEQLFSNAKNKAIAQPTPSVTDINILISGEALGTFFSYYKERAHAQTIYQKLSTYQVGDQVQGDENCDKITLTVDPLMEGGPQSAPYDFHGFPLTRQEIIKDGKLLKLWGDVRFSHYLEIEPTGRVPNLHVTGGTASLADLKAAPYLELVSFSAFQTDWLTGDFGSEIRLGYYFNGTETIPVTGGSISGNMEKIHNSLKMTTTESQYAGAKTPETICIRGASISGAAK